ncbi:MAG: non-hydrolyzing UDP-N-acetylglucosamine 2-epimerase [Alphaproteobacteria bacterium]
MSGVVIFGTRPEAIKLAPVIEGLRQRLGPQSLRVLCTGQHGALMAQTLASLGLAPDENFDLMLRDQTPSAVLRRSLEALQTHFQDERPDWVLVQGDTASTLAGALFGHLVERPVFHLEAGLRTYDRSAPWPEEGFRQVIGRLASLHLAPTPRARNHLLAEGVADADIVVVGNPGLDSQDRVMATTPPQSGVVPDGPFFLVTLHRRESLGQQLDATCRRLADLLGRYPGHAILWPVHPNPAVMRAANHSFTDGAAAVRLCAPLSYPDFLHAQAAARIVISDSGGVQEEAPSMGTPVAIVRDKTERQDVIELGLGRLVGADARDIDDAVDALLAAPLHPDAVATWRALQGDGNATAATVAAIAARLRRTRERLQRA